MVRAPTLRTTGSGLLPGCSAAEPVIGVELGICAQVGEHWDEDAPQRGRARSWGLLQRRLLLERLVPWCCPGSCSFASMIFFLEHEKDWI